VAASVDGQLATATTGRLLRHAGIDHSTEAEADAHEVVEPSAGGGRAYTWLKWTAAAVLLVEGLIGVLLPVVLKMTVHAGWLLSLVNCFAGGVFFAFGVLHLAPDAISTQRVTGPDNFPLAAFLIALAFFVVFFLHRVLAPALRLSPHLHSHYAVTTPDGRPIMPRASKENGVADCKRCGDECGCAGGVGAGGCGSGCQAGSCQCAHRKESSSEDDEVKMHVAGFGSTAATLAEAASPVTRPYDDELAPPQPAAVRVAALVPPILILLGILCHTVLEGLAIGLQKSFADVVTSFVAMASHKWVESIAVAAAFVSAGAGLLSVIAFLVPFALGPMVGVAIGVSVSDTNAWVVMVLFALVAGLFIYVGSVGIVAEEFARHDNPAFAATRPRGARFYMYGAMFAGFVVVALLQLVP
jgi:zinc transporter 1/2/3